MDSTDRNQRKEEETIREEIKQEEKEMPEYKSQGNIAWGFRGWMILGIIATLIIFIILIFFD